MTATLDAPVTAAVGDLLLVRMALPGATPKKVRDDLGKLLGTDVPSAEFDEMRIALSAGGFLERRPGNVFGLTDAGRVRVFNYLGIDALPSRANWGTVIAKYLLPRALGISAEAAAKYDSGEKLTALVIRRKYQLPAGSGGSPKQIIQAVVCKHLGYPNETTLDGLLRTVMSEKLGADERLTKDELAQKLAERETELKSRRADQVRRKLVRDWLAADREPASTEPAEPFDLPTFANTVLALARSRPAADRFYDNKVFIAPLWQASQREPGFPRLTLPVFKGRLVEANARHLLHLSQADEIQLMNPRLLADSETIHLGVKYHFVLLETNRP